MEERAKKIEQGLKDSEDTDKKIVESEEESKKMLAKAKSEAKQIMVTINFINDGGAFSMHFSEKDIPKTKKMLKNKFEKTLKS